eukprot:Selendium_serpulae@DN6164_c0_g1_i1.p1
MSYICEMGYSPKSIDPMECLAFDEKTLIAYVELGQLVPMEGTLADLLAEASNQDVAFSERKYKCTKCETEMEIDEAFGHAQRECEDVEPEDTSHKASPAFKCGHCKRKFKYEAFKKHVKNDFANCSKVPALVSRSDKRKRTGT